MSILRVETGLNVLAGVSKAIKNGNSAEVPSIFRRSAISVSDIALSDIGVSIEQGANAVLAEVGINPQILGALGLSTRSVTLAAKNVAQGVFTSVINGSFGFSDINQSVKKPLEDLSILVENSEVFNNNSDDTNLTPSPYATDKSQMDNHPKFKFLFIVEFIFEDDFQEALSENGNNMAFVVRSSSRPNVNVDYEEVNMYNFKTKVAKFTEYQPITMSFFDDQSNQTTSFYKKYLELLIPNMGMPESTTAGYETSSFNFSDDRDQSPFNSSSLQALPGKSGHKNIIKTIRLFHIWGWGQYANVYKFHNPKISEVNVSDLDMETNDLSEIQIQFSYDGLNIETVAPTGKPISLDPSSPDAAGYNIPNYSIAGNRGKYPLRYNGSSNNSKKMNGNNTELPKILKKKSLDIVDFRNPNAPDSDFRGEDETNSPGFFPDFGKLLDGVTDTTSNLLSGAGINMEKIANTINAAKQTLGNSIPNVNNIDNLLGSAFDNLPTLDKISNSKIKNQMDYMKTQAYQSVQAKALGIAKTATKVIGTGSQPNYFK